MQNHAWTDEIQYVKYNVVLQWISRRQYNSLSSNGNHGASQKKRLPMHNLAWTDVNICLKINAVLPLMSRRQ